MAGYIDSIDETSPLITDDPADFPAEMREFKNKVKISFPNVAGAVTATNTELNYTDITTVGTAQASKAVVLDVNKDVTGIRNITAATQSAGDNSTNVATTAYVDRHLYLPLQKLRDADGTNFDTGSTNYTRISPLFTVTPTEANTKLEGYFVVNCKIQTEAPATTDGATGLINAGYVDTGGAGQELSGTQSINIYEDGDNSIKSVEVSITIPFVFDDTMLDASGNWVIHVRGKVTGSDDLLENNVTFVVAEEFIE